MDLKSFYLSTEGRVSRGEWWLWVVVPTVLIPFIGTALDVTMGINPGDWPLGLVTMLSLWFVTYPMVNVTIKRLHDHGKSGWWYLFYAIPGPGWMWNIIECGCLRGTVGENRYGPDPVPAP
jgi:uncharacterized membrane protein YhaH (DUF805 family)